jgi:fructoselysine-6-P-deglycase FrlB-like protein
MSHASEEIARQPAAWQRAVTLAADSHEALPQPGEWVAVVGCGTSWFMAEAYAVLRETAGQGETDCFAASHFPEGRRYDRLIAITRSGTTTEILRLLDAGTGAPTTAITADAHTPVMQLADQAIVLDFADEHSVVQTLFATTALTLLRAHLGVDLTRPIAEAHELTVQPLPEALLAASQFTFLGQGWAHGVARGAALTMREAAQMWTESYPAMEYRHGPIAIAEPGRVVWVFGPTDPRLAEDVLATGATLVDDGYDPVADLIRAQRLAVALAEQRGLDVDHPRHLTRSVVLGS